MSQYDKLPGIATYTFAVDNFSPWVLETHLTAIARTYMLCVQMQRVSRCFSGVTYNVSPTGCPCMASHSGRKGTGIVVRMAA